MAVDYALNVWPLSIHRGVDRRFGRNRSRAGQPLSVEINGANVLGIREDTGETRIDQKRFRSRNTHAQMPGSGKHTLAGDDLNSLDDSLLERVYVVGSRSI